MKSSTKTAMFLFAASCALSIEASGMTFAAGQPQESRNVAPLFRYGTIDGVTPGAFLKIDGVNYIFSSGLATVRDENGRVIASTRLTKGMKVKFLAATDGSQARINDIWMDKQ